jgi:hypothetical protein
VNPTAQLEIDDYVEKVRAALIGLPDSTRDELVEDLPEHLAEVLAEGQGTLVERLGTPEAYASELRATAGFVGGFPDPPPPAWVPLQDFRETAVKWLNIADVRIGPVIGYERARDFLVLLRPAWWVLRGYLAAMAIAYLLDSGDPGLLPRIGGSDLVALILLAGCVTGSILIGKRQPALTRWPLYAVRAATVFLIIFAFGGFLSADSQARYGDSYNDVSSYDNNPYSNVRDVFVYDQQGKLVPGARLFDQEGSPIVLGDGYCNDPETGESWRTRSMGYPHCPELAPFGPTPSAQPTPTRTTLPGVGSEGIGGSAVPASPATTVPTPTVTPATPAAPGR